MNSSVTRETATSVVSSSCLGISLWSRSNVASNVERATENPDSQPGSGEASLHPGCGSSVKTSPVPLGSLPTRVLSLTMVTYFSRRRGGGTRDTSGHCAAHEQFACELPIGLRGIVLGRDLGKRSGGNRSIRELDRAGDDGFQNLVTECLPDSLEPLAGVESASVVHGGKNTVERNSGVEPLTLLLDRFDEQAHPAQRKVLSLERDEHTVARRERVDGQ